jgi:hypothetical protein
MEATGENNERERARVRRQWTPNELNDRDERYASVRSNNVSVMTVTC